MKNVFIGVLVICQLSLLGCGGAPGSLTQEDLKKRAIKRKKDEETPPAQSNTATNVVAQSSVTQSAANTKSSQNVINTSALNPNTPSTAQVASRGAVASPMPSTSLPATVTELPPVVQTPAQPLSTGDRIKFASENMSQINQAVLAYVEQNGRFPPPAMSVQGRPTLSWRVAILPMLGHQALYDQFKLDETWNSPHNKQLLARIPRQFQSPERFDQSTNYVLASGPSTVFPRPAKGLTPRQIDDGRSNTAILLEVDDDAAVPWTKPADISINLREPTRHLGSLRGNFFLVGWADGLVTAVGTAAAPNKLKAMFTVDAGEPFFATEIQSEIPTGPIASTMADDSARSQNPQVASATTSPTASSRPGAGHVTSRQAEPFNNQLDYNGPNTPTGLRALQARLPVPDAAARKKSQQLVQTIFGEKYRAAKTPEEKWNIAVAMLDESKKVERGSADEYTLLRTGWKIAIGASHYEMAEKFRLALVETFAVPDELKLQAEAVRRLSLSRLNAVQIDNLLTTARHAIEDAMHVDDFDTARDMQQVAERLARRARDAATVRQLGQTGTTLARLAREYRKVSALLGSVGNSNDPQASYQVGRYFCFFKGQWERGLPLLAEGSDLQTRRLAAEELAVSINPSDQIAVADGWWELSEDATLLEKVHLQKHAVTIYQRALSGLRGLTKTKVTMRIDEYYREFAEREPRRRLAIKNPARARNNRDDDD